MRRVKAGRLRHLVVIEQITEQPPTDEGQPKPKWGTFAQRWASVEPIEGFAGGREYLQAAAIQADVSHVVTMRYLANVTPKMRVNYGGRILEIQAVGNIEERGRMTVLGCKERFV